jgi:hypothetical protein
MNWHRMTHRHKYLVIGVATVEFCKLRFSPASFPYTIKIHRGPGYIWEIVPRPKKTEDLDEWWAGLNLDMPE